MGVPLDDALFMQILKHQQIKMVWKLLSMSFWFCLVKEELARVQLLYSLLLDWCRLATGYVINSTNAVKHRHQLCKDAKDVPSQWSSDAWAKTTWMTDIWVTWEGYLGDISLTFGQYTIWVIDSGMHIYCDVKTLTIFIFWIIQLKVNQFLPHDAVLA